ncbi:hypothetical protein Emed_000976 [Eimeria media]
MLRFVQHTVSSVREGVVDFEAQQFIQTFLSCAACAGTLIGFVAGLLLQSFSVCCLSVAVTAVITSIVCIPSWPIYKRHQIQWATHDPQHLAKLYSGEAGVPVPDGEELPPPSSSQTQSPAAAADGKNGSRRKSGGGETRKRR